MKSDSWERVTGLFEAALELAPADRRAFLEKACPGQDELQQQVKELLANHEEAEANGFLAQAPVSSLLKQRGTEKDSMGLAPGTDLGHYRLVARIGAGGMGEVYKAKDTRLRRTVAIKVLPEHLAKDPRRRERFEREARAVSKLNHPHICTLHDIGQHNGIDFIVMEYIEGETLADRLKGALPMDQALQYGIQIADALDKVHRQGVVHRDLKPGNVMLTKSGAKVIDLGLAKQLDAHEASKLSSLPIKEKPLTEDGVILGTLQYMAPEQLEGKEADARTDIFAFGSLLYEMVTGKKVFDGKSQASLISAIMSADPRPLSELQPLSPPALDRVVNKCLAKDGDDRWQTSLDLRDELQWIREGNLQPAGIQAADTIRAKKRGRLAWVAALITSAILAGMAVWGRMLHSPEPPRPIKRFAIPLPPDVALPSGWGSYLALSPDGTQLAFVGNRGGVLQLFLRSMEQGDTRAMPGTEGARHPAFSADGDTIAFDVRGQIFKVSHAGGPPVALAVAGTYPTWGPDGSLFFQKTGLFWRIPAKGGEPEAVIGSTETEAPAGRRPKVLPNGKAVLFARYEGNSVDPGGSLEGTTVEVLSLETGEQRSLVTWGTNPHYASSGHILFARAGSLFAVPFDAERLQVTGPATAVLQDLRMDEGGGAAQFTVASDGSLVYARQSTRALDRTLVRVDRQGKARAITEKRHRFRHPRLSPDGRRVAVTITDSNGSNLWIQEIDRDILTRLTFEGGSIPIWSPDGMRLAFFSKRAGASSVLVKSAGGGDEVETARELASGGASPSSCCGTFPSSWSSDGRVMILSELEGNLDITLLRLDGDGKPEPLLGTRFNELQAALSPDDRWLAYTSDETGRSEVFVVPFPEASPKRRISTEGGTEPMWARDGRELFYRNGDKMMAVAIDTEPELFSAKPVLLFEGPYAQDTTLAFFDTPWITNYDVAPDGEGFIMIQQEERGGSRAELEVVLNWFDELERLVPTEN